MRSLSAAALMVVLAGTGCTREGALIAGGTSLALVGVGGYLNYTAGDDCHNCNIETTTADWAVPVGLGVAIIVLTALAVHHYPSEDGADAAPPAGLPPVDEAHAHDREQALQLFHTAKAGADSGDCTTAIRVEPVVHRLDLEVHAVLFVRDPAIQRCLATVSGSPAPAS